MRTAYIDAMMRAAREDPSIFLLVGDLGFGVIEPFAQAYPDQFANAGIAEQNMTGMAAGLARSGYKVFTYSIANFTTLRCFEQIRNDVCYHDANVNVVSVGGGYAYGALSFTHHATEDLAVMRALPNMTVVAPADPQEAAQATLALINDPHPSYLRLNRAGDPPVHRSDITFELGKAIEVMAGSDVTLIGTEAIMGTVVEAADQLHAQGVSTRVLSMHTVKPIDQEALVRAANETSLLVTVEEHSIVGGLGSAVLESLTDAGVAPQVQRIGLCDRFVTTYGSQAYLREQAGLTATAIVDRVMSSIRTPSYTVV